MGRKRAPPESCCRGEKPHIAEARVLKNILVIITNEMTAAYTTIKNPSSVPVCVTYLSSPFNPL
jgi:hypothetical protein